VELCVAASGASVVSVIGFLEICDAMVTVTLTVSPASNAIESPITLLPAYSGNSASAMSCRQRCG